MFSVPHEPAALAAGEADVVAVGGWVAAAGAGVGAEGPPHASSASATINSNPASKSNLRLLPVPMALSSRSIEIFSTPKLTFELKSDFACRSYATATVSLDADNARGD
jgi:hypothetical protein